MGECRSKLDAAVDHEKYKITCAAAKIIRKKIAELEAFRDLFKRKLEDQINTLSATATRSVAMKNQQDQMIEKLLKEKSENEKTLTEKLEVVEKKK